MYVQNRTITNVVERKDILAILVDIFASDTRFTHWQRKVNK